jgi:NAD(P)-dependent dehydrogenase (short-subunit alcohol dehydrogenase family)
MGENSRVVLISGASAGIGQACATHLQQQGYRVYGTSRFVQESDCAYNMIQMDVNDDQSVDAGIDLILSYESRLDVVVNNAGYGLAGAFEDTTIDEAKAQFETNFFGVMRVCRAALPMMRDQRAGHIVNISSLGGVFGIPFQSIYSASKFALEGAMEAFRLEVKPFGVQVVLIEPGNFKTEITARRRRAAAAEGISVYTNPFRAALRVMEADEINGASPNQIAHLLEKIISMPSPRLRYPVGATSEKLVLPARKFLPARLYEWLIARYFDLS